MKTTYCFDLDGTITKREILPELAKVIDLKDEMSILTKITMMGLIDFESSFKLRVKLLSQIKNTKIKTIINTIPINNFIVNFIKENIDDCYIITNNLDCWVSEFIENKIGCKYFSSTSLVKNDNVVKIENILIKGDIIIKLKQKYDRIIVIGDGFNDLSMFEESDIGISCGIIHQPPNIIKEISNYIIYSEQSLCKILKLL